ncbi:MAG: Spy/CpxP family protein refolding chaperone [Steroidobacter sp.]
MNMATRVSIMAIFSTLATMAMADPAGDTAPAAPMKHHQMMHHGMAEHGPMMMHDRPFLMAVHQLDLTADQKKQIHDIMEKSEAQMKANRAAHKDEFSGLMNPGDPNYASAVQAMKDAAVAHIEQMSNDNTQIYGLLTDKQKAELPKVLEKMKARAKERMNHWKEHHGAGASSSSTPAN